MSPQGDWEGWGKGEDEMEAVKGGICFSSPCGQQKIKSSKNFDFWYLSPVLNHFTCVLDFEFHEPGGLMQALEIVF